MHGASVVRYKQAGVLVAVAERTSCYQFAAFVRIGVEIVTATVGVCHCEARTVVDKPQKLYITLTLPLRLFVIGASDVDFVLHFRRERLDSARQYGHRLHLARNERIYRVDYIDQRLFVGLVEGDGDPSRFVIIDHESVDRSHSVVVLVDVQISVEGVGFMYAAFGRSDRQSASMLAAHAVAFDIAVVGGISMSLVGQQYDLGAFRNCHYTSDPSVFARSLADMAYGAYEMAVVGIEKEQAGVVAHRCHVVDYHCVADHSLYLSVFSKQSFCSRVEQRISDIL